jgi:hypothetical protein
MAVDLKPQYALSNEALKRVLSLAWHSPDHSYTGRQETLGPYDLLPLACATASTLHQQQDLELHADKACTLMLGNLEWANCQNRSDQHPTKS